MFFCVSSLWSLLVVLGAFSMTSLLAPIPSSESMIPVLNVAYDVSSFPMWVYK